MSIEQRLEAVTHTLELVAHAQHDSENRLNRLTAALEETHAIVRNLSDVVDTFNRAMAATSAGGRKL